MTDAIYIQLYQAMETDPSFHVSYFLTLYHTIPTFKDPKKEGFGKHYGKRRKCW